MAVRYLSESDVQRLELPTSSVVGAIEKVIKDVLALCAWSAPKSVILPADGRYIMTTLAVSDDPAYMAVKAVVLNPHNAAKGLASIDGVVTILDSHTGQPKALVDGKSVTAIRTAGLSLLAAKYLARRDSADIALLGCGVQARAHLTAFSDAYPLKTVHLFGRGTANIDAMAALAEKRGHEVRIADAPEAAMQSADVVVSSLTRDPDRARFLDAGQMREGAFATITDLAEPWIQSSLSAFDQIYIDDIEQEKSSTAKLADPALVLGDLSALVSGRAPGRTDEKQRTAFIFRGLGLADLAVAGLALHQAEKNGVGSVIDS